MGDFIAQPGVAQAPKIDPLKAKRQRSPAYPFISLKTALERAKEFYDKEKRNPSNVLVAVTHWDYAQKSSGGIQTIAALKSFGLMRDSGSGDGRSVQLTDEALRILLDQRENSSERDALIKNAALLPPIHSVLWKRWGKENMPSDGNLRHELLFTYKFNEDAIDNFIRQYKSTISFAKLSTSDALPEEARDIGSDTEEASDRNLYVPSVGEYVQWEPGGILQFKEPRRIVRLSGDGRFAFVDGSNTGVPVEQLTKQAPPAFTPPSGRDRLGSPPLKVNMREDVFSLAEGNVTFQWPAPLSPDSIQDLKDWLKILERKISRPAPAGQEPSENAE
ncbi:MAG: hypothetical protein ABSE46_10280 [Terracidiphilus sp.]|jgi:hypothetical protein